MKENLKPKKSLFSDWEIKNIRDAAFEDGKIAGLLEWKRESELEGILEGKQKAQTEVATALKQQGIAVDMIVLATGLTIEEIEHL